MKLRWLLVPAVAVAFAGAFVATGLLTGGARPTASSVNPGPVVTVRPSGSAGSTSGAVAPPVASAPAPGDDLATSVTFLVGLAVVVVAAIVVLGASRRRRAAVTRAVPAGTVLPAPTRAEDPDATNILVTAPAATPAPATAGRVNWAMWGPLFLSVPLGVLTNLISRILGV